MFNRKKNITIFADTIFAVEICDFIDSRKFTIYGMDETLVGGDKVCITCTTIISANRMAKLLGKTLYKTKTKRKIQGSVIFIEEES